LFSPTSENPPTPRRGRSDFQFGVYLQSLTLNHATTHSRDRYGKVYEKTTKRKTTDKRTAKE